jgi:hypothetical protein
VAINFTNHLEIGSDVFIATGCWLHAWGGNCPGGRSATRAVRRSGLRGPHANRWVLQVRPEQSCADSHLQRIVDRGPCNGHKGCPDRMRRYPRGQFRGHAQRSAVCDGGRRACAGDS